MAYVIGHATRCAALPGGGEAARCLLGDVLIADGFARSVLFCPLSVEGAALRNGHRRETYKLSGDPILRAHQLIAGTADDGLIGTVASAAIRNQSPRGSFSLDGSLVGGLSHQVEGEIRTTAIWLARKRDWCSLKVTSRVPCRLSSMASGFSPVRLRRRRERHTMVADLQT
jgi:hypothetical protein